MRMPRLAWFSYAPVLAPASGASFVWRTHTRRLLGCRSVEARDGGWGSTRDDNPPFGKF